MVAMEDETGPHAMEVPERLVAVAEARGWQRVIFKYSGVSLARTELRIAQRNPNRTREDDGA